MGAKNVVITGISEGTKMVDFILEKNIWYVESGNKISNINHGSGCNYSSSMICAMVNGKSIKESTKFAKKYTYDSIRNAKRIGKGIAITQNRDQDETITELNRSISKFVSIKNIYKNIPECQTNFVFSKKDPKSIKDILGVKGRIVRIGKRVTVAGNLEYGGSKHVATALITMNQKFPEIRSAINLKYQPETISKLRKRAFRVSRYDRIKEPKKVKMKGSTVEWGIKSAIMNFKMSPDVIYHKGDFGKEAMIIIFGKTPTEVLKKVSKITHSHKR